VIEEPTAAAVAYDLHKKKNVHHILVYDFGGGTLDVSLLYVAKGSVQVYATDGDEDLGGSDFDMCLYGIIMDKVCCNIIIHRLKISNS
jgi:molecular chaperone DnaK (HSP70)